MSENIIFGERHFPLYKLFSAVAVISVSLLLSVTVGFYHIAVIASTAVIAALVMKSELTYTDRPIIYSLLICLTTAVFSDMIYPIDKENFILLGGIFTSNVTAPLLIFLAAGTVFFKFNYYTAGFCISFCLAAIVLVSDIMFSSSSQSTAKNYTITYVSLTVLVFISVFAILQSIKFVVARKGLAGIRLKKTAIIFSAVLAMVAISVFGFATFKRYEKRIRMVDNFLIRLGMMRLTRNQYIVFGNEVNLNRTISDRVETNSSLVVIRAIADSPPGYLRGRSYDFYANGTWSSSKNEGRQMRLIRNDAVFTFNTFTMDADGEAENGNPIQIFFSKKFNSDVLLYPGNMRSVDMTADNLTISQNGVMSPSNWDVRNGYVAYQKVIEPESAFPLPLDFQISEYLQISKDAEDPVSKFISTTMSKRKDADFSCDRELADYFASYFVNNFKYEIHIELKNSRGGNPLVKFFSRKSGHCELFATATALMLRKCGIPARYVTGFICEEANPIAGTYYVSRLGNAHAWVEAYLRDEKKWILVEPTPPSAMPISDEAWDPTDAWIDFIKTAFAGIFADVRKGFFAKAVFDVIESLLLMIKTMFSSVFGASMIVFGMILLCLARFLAVSRKKSRHADLHPDMLRLIHEFRRFEKRFRSDTGFWRKPHETIEEFMAEIASGSEAGLKFAEIASLYQRIRYSSPMGAPDKEGTEEFIRMSRAFKAR